MKEWKKVRLDECCEIVAGSTPSTNVASYWEGDICWVTPRDMSDLNGAYISDTPRKLTQSGLSSCAATILPTDSVLFSSRAPIGHVAINTVPMATNQGFKSFIPKANQIYSKYLYYWLKINRSYLESLGNGATFKEVSKSIVSRIEILLPPLEEQKRIAEILDRAESLRAMRRQSIEQLNTLSQAIFLEMFGDPVTNPKGWKRLAFSELLANIDSGWSPVCLDRSVEGEEWGVLKLGAVTKCEYKPSENKALPPDVQPNLKIEVKQGDLLFTRKNTYELIAACALVKETPPRLLMSDLIFRFRLREDAPVNSSFLHQLLIYPTKRQAIQKLAGGSSSSMPNISKTKLQATLVEAPPIALQQKFAQRVEAIEKLKATHQQSLTELDALFASLQHRAFRGEL
jgi:type I restriction enzyme, S subunit